MRWGVSEGVVPLDPRRARVDFLFLWLGHLAKADGRVTEAWVNAPMYRGFEQILQGKHPFDAMVYVPRICGICSVAQSAATALALADAAGIAPPRNGRSSPRSRRSSRPWPNTGWTRSSPCWA